MLNGEDDTITYRDGLLSVEDEGLHVLGGLLVDGKGIGTRVEELHNLVLEEGLHGPEVRLFGNTLLPTYVEHQG